MIDVWAEEPRGASGRPSRPRRWPGDWPLATGSLRKALDLRPGDALVSHVDEGRLVIEKAEAVERRLHGLFRRFEGRRLADELIAARRAEARREGGS